MTEETAAELIRRDHSITLGVIHQWAGKVSAGEMTDVAGRWALVDMLRDAVTQRLQETREVQDDWRDPELTEDKLLERLEEAYVDFLAELTRDNSKVWARVGEMAAVASMLADRAHFEWMQEQEMEAQARGNTGPDTARE
jgi:hypothetical protein